MDLSSVTDEELQGIVRRKLLGESQSYSQERQRTECPKQKVVKVEETNTYLERGWEYVAKLTENTVVLRNSLEPNDVRFKP
jgi:flagellar biosynthesis/type III secretory pathway chaperone